MMRSLRLFLGVMGATWVPLSLACAQVRVPVGANSWIFDEAGRMGNGQVATKEGLRNWSDARDRARTYFWVGNVGTLEVRVQASVPKGESKIRCVLGGQEKVVTLSEGSAGQMVEVGRFEVRAPGYQVLEWQGVSKTGATFAEIQEVELGGAVGQGEVRFVKDDLHFGRRGPSVHLGYELPKEMKEVTWVYSEVSVPEGLDALGTYCMVNGFGEGYSGMQVNSARERRILFSVWSPFKTDDPKAIPEGDRVRLLKKGKDVHAQAFGGEGAGGQSYLVYPWKAGTVYRFLLHGEPTETGETVYTAYFFPPEEGRWKLLASFQRPKTRTYLTHWHAFLENFVPDAGATLREARYLNAWACDKEGRWMAPLSARFTADATARKGARMDYDGGVTPEGHFYLRNCGFFSPHRPFDTVLKRERPPQGPPQIDFSALPTE